MKDENVEWSRGLFRSMREGGIWAVPRSGLIFTRQGDTLVLTVRMPYDAALPFSEDLLIAMQRSDFEAIAQHMRAAGVLVFDSTSIDPAS